MNDPKANFKVHQVQELKKRDSRDEALKMLEQVARQVQPILRKREWTVPIVKEFFPGNPNLLVCTFTIHRGNARDMHAAVRATLAHVHQCTNPVLTCIKCECRV